MQTLRLIEQPLVFPAAGRSRTNLNASFPRSRRHVVPKASSNGESPILKQPNWLERAIGSLPLVGLALRLTSEEGGVGNDRLHYAEYCKRVENRLPGGVKQALLDFEKKFGRAARTRNVLLWCWIASVGAGAIRRDDILLSARRLRASSDMDYELCFFDTLLDEAFASRSARDAMAAVPMIVRSEMALDAIVACCVGSKELGSDGWNLLQQILGDVFSLSDSADFVAFINERQASTQAAEPAQQAAES